MQNNRYSDNRYIGYENYQFQYWYRFINHVVSLLKAQKKILICCYDIRIYKIVHTYMHL